METVPTLVPLAPAPSSRAPASRWRRTVGVLLLAAAVGTAGVVVAGYRGTTSNPGNSTSTGTVVLGDNDGGSAPMFASGADGQISPSRSVSRCIAVTYSGSLVSEVRLYSAGLAGAAAAPGVDVKVEVDAPPTGFPACTGFATTHGGFAVVRTVWQGRADTFPTAWAGGVPLWPGQNLWAPGDSAGLRFTVTGADDATPEAHAAVGQLTAQTFTWEARNRTGRVVAAAPAAQQLPLVVGQSITLQSTVAARSSFALSARAGQPAQLAVLAPESALLDRRAATFVVRAGLADTACRSLESVADTGYYLRHASNQVRLDVLDSGSTAYKNDATFCPEVGDTAGSIRLRSKNYPANVVLAERDGTVWMDASPVAASSWQVSQPWG